MFQYYLELTVVFLFDCAKNENMSSVIQSIPCEPSRSECILCSGTLKMLNGSLSWSAIGQQAK